MQPVEERVPLAAEPKDFGFPLGGGKLQYDEAKRTMS